MSRWKWHLQPVPVSTAAGGSSCSGHTEVHTPCKAPCEACCLSIAASDHGEDCTFIFVVYAVWWVLTHGDLWCRWFECLPRMKIYILLLALLMRIMVVRVFVAQSQLCEAHWWTACHTHVYALFLPMYHTHLTHNSHIYKYLIYNYTITIEYQHPYTALYHVYQYRNIHTNILIVDL